MKCLVWLGGIATGYGVGSLPEGGMMGIGNETLGASHVAPVVGAGGVTCSWAISREV